MPYWNAYVANLADARARRFFDPRLDDAKKFPVAARSTAGTHPPRRSDLVTAKLAALQYYQLVDTGARRRRRVSFDAGGGRSAARRCSTARRAAPTVMCRRCSREPGWPMHTPRGDRHRLVPGQSLAGRALSHDAAARASGPTPKGGYYHDGRFADLNAVVDHYNQAKHLNLSTQEQHDLVEYLKSL